MQRPAKKPKLRKGRDREPPTRLTFRDKLQIWGLIGGLFAVGLAWGHYFTTTQTARHREQTLNRWRKDFHLTDEQADRIRVIERDFHGSGNPFLKPSHNAEEVRAHHREMAAVMNPEDGERFIRAHEGRKNHH